MRLVEFRNQPPKKLCAVALGTPRQMAQKITDFREDGRRRSYDLETTKETIQELEISFGKCTGVLEPVDPARIVGPHDVEQKQVGVDEPPFSTVLDEKLVDVATHSLQSGSSSKGPHQSLHLP